MPEDEIVIGQLGPPPVEIQTTATVDNPPVDVGITPADVESHHKTSKPSQRREK
jgi:hypothetical protein